MDQTAQTAAVNEVRQYVGDLTDVSRFLSYLPPSSAIPSIYSPEYYAWKITRNPFGGSASFLRTRNGQPAAHLCVTAKPTNDALIGHARLGEMCDAHTRPEFQRQGHFGVVGCRTIEHFERAAKESSLIFAGGPNANSLPGFLRQCGCQLFEPIQLRDVRLEPWRRPAQLLNDLPARLSSRMVLERARDTESTSQRIDEVWTRAASAGWLVKKSGAWWKWRYAEGTERYTTYFLLDGSDTLGWTVVKRTATRLPSIGRTAIADIVCVTPEAEAAAFGLLLRSVAGPLDIIITWAQDGTPVGDVIARLPFHTVREVPIVFADTEAFGRLKQGRTMPRLSMGDTDNV